MRAPPASGATALLRGPVDPGMPTRLHAGVVHAWRASLDPPPEEVHRLASCLSPDEQRRAERFRFARDRRRWTVFRGLLRVLLAGYLQRAPEAIAFRYGHGGKPELPAPGADLRFNASRSGNVAIYALARGRRIGVDVEAVRPLPDVERLAETVLSGRERAELAAHTPSARTEAFLRAWTRKEAFVKAVGDGLTRSLPSVEVSPSDDAAHALLAVDGDTAAASHWTLRPLVIGRGYAAAVALEGTAARVEAWTGRA